MSQNTKLIAVAAILVFIFCGGGAAVVSGITWLGTMLAKIVMATIIAYASISVAYVLFYIYMARSSETSGVVFA